MTINHIKLNLLYLLSSFILIILISGCEYEKIEPVLAPDNVIFSSDVQPIFTSKCISCHGGTQAPDLREQNSYSVLTAGSYLNLTEPENSNFYKKISGSGSMAQYATNEDRAIILRWIELGALDN